MKTSITRFERELLLSNPETTEIAKALIFEGTRIEGTEDQFEELREACVDLLQRIGFDEGDETTAEGRTLEGLIDALHV